MGMGLAFFIGPALGGFVFQEYGGDVLWAALFGIGVVLFVSYLVLARVAGGRVAPRATSG